MNAEQQNLLYAINADRWLGMQMLFPHRHSEDSPGFHKAIVELWRSAHPFVVIEAFRGGAKSTVSEEFLSLESLFANTRYCLVVSDTYEVACQRLTAIKGELETNERIHAIFGDPVGKVWRENEIVLSNGTKLQALGQGQQIRGLKHGTYRPDRCLIDDLENRETAGTREARRKLKRWFYSELLPALDPKAKTRMVGTPLDPECLIEDLMTSPEWVSRRFPIQMQDGTPMWAERFDATAINAIRERYERAGELSVFYQEYLCQAMANELSPFQAEHIQIISSVPYGTPRYIAVDPARTVKKTSDTTGMVDFSWVGTKLIVHRSSGERMKPDAIINQMFDWANTANPIKVGVEEDGLNEFILQPIRAEMVRRRTPLPLAPLKAPRGKDDFILGLQPFLLAGDIEFVGAQPALLREMESFPQGKKDVLNALAYALLMRPGKPVYEDFTPDHIRSELVPHPRVPLMLAFNATQAVTTACLLQYADSRIQIFRDWVSHNNPIEAIEDILREAKYEYPNSRILIYVPEELHEAYVHVQLVKALRDRNQRPLRSPYSQNAYGSLAQFIRSRIRGEPGLLVDELATWTVNGLSGGYAHTVRPDGRPSERPEQDNYAVLISGLESVSAMSAGLLDNTAELNQNTAEKNGKTYISAVAGRRK